MNKKEYSQIYYQANKEKVKKRVKKHYQIHKEELLQYHKNYANTHKEERNLSNRELMRKRRLEIFFLLGNKCSNPLCLVPNGCSDIRCLQIDHVKGHGNLERKKFSYTIGYLRNILDKIKSGSRDYQLLCANCNWIKSWENKERVDCGNFYLKKPVKVIGKLGELKDEAKRERENT